MPDFDVTVVRTVHQCKTIRVRALGVAEAKNLAEERAPNEDFSGTEKEAGYDAIDVIDVRHDGRK